MTSELGTASRAAQWLMDNAAKVKSVIGAVGVYIASLQAVAAAAPGDKWQHFWHILKEGSLETNTTIVLGVLMAAISAWRTDSTTPSKRAEKKQAKRDADDDARLEAALERRNGNGDSA